ncbi:HAD family hydrolase [Chloroflexota bacterium]
MKAFLFDFDGTLVFLRTNYLRMKLRLFWMFCRYGIISAFSPLLDSIENSLHKLERKGYPVSFLEEIRHKAYNIVSSEEVSAVKKARLVPGAEELLSLLRQNEIAIAVISKNGTHCIQACIDKLNVLEPDLIISRDDVHFEELKPSPVQVARAIDKLRLSREEVVIIGDSPDDIQAGRNLDIYTILVNRNKGYRNAGLAPDWTVPDLYHIINNYRLLNRSS